MRFLPALITLACAARLAHAQNIPVRQLSAPVGTDSGVLKAIFAVRPLSNGTLLVNEAFRHRVFLFDATMKNPRVVLDSADAAYKYAANSGNIIPYIGDTTLFLDYDAKALVVIDPSGNAGRTMAMIRSTDALMMVAGSSAMGYDPRGRFIMRLSRSAVRLPPATDSTLTTEFRRDSMAIMRLDPETKQADTVALVGMTPSKSVNMRSPTGSAGRSAPNPLPTPDEWTLLPDGTVAVVRSHDYHIDWYTPDGKVTSTPKMAFAWRRITPEEKQQIADSVRKVGEAREATAPTTTSLGGVTRTIPRLPAVYYDANELPDYYPPIRANQVKADPDGNVWILPTTSNVQGAGIVYDVINRKGEVFERVALPEGRNLIAVGTNGVVYMSYTPRGGIVRIERATVIR